MNKAEDIIFSAGAASSELLGAQVQIQYFLEGRRLQNLKAALVRIERAKGHLERALK